ncbi:MAG: ribonuclease HII [Methylococcales bacterium]|nr:ribonuclease HII [Methylococcales bacterium]
MQFIDEVPEHFLIAGVDEVGRGCLAGSVVAAAVILDATKPIAGLADSKKLTERKREYLSQLIQEKALSWAIAEASVVEIDSLNILQATLIAMQRAVAGLQQQPDRVLVDGNRLPSLTMPAQAIIKGDSKIAAISAASIIAKVYRDKLMVDYHRQHPNFSFHRHKSYGTSQHLLEIQQFGFLEIHRKTFNPVKTLIALNASQF